MKAAHRLLASLALFALFSGPLAAADDGNPFNDDSDEAFFVDRRHKVEFLENVSKQTYLNQISFDDRYVLDLYLLDQNLKNENFVLDGQFLRGCPRAVFKSLGLSGLANPALRTGSIAICPNMRANCCTNNDFVGLEAIWQDFFAYLELNYDYFSHFAKTTLKMITTVVAKADALRTNSPHMICRSIGETFAKFRAEDLSVDKFIGQLTKVKTYDLSLKRGFKCMLCDHGNNQFIDLQNRVVHYRNDFCVDIVKNTFPFYQNMNDFFLRYFNSAAMVAKCSSNHGLGSEKVFPFKLEEPIDFLEIKSSFYDAECRRVAQSGSDEEIATACRNYCHKFDMWSFQGILPDMVKMGRMFSLIAENLLPVQEIEALKPKDDLITYAFPFQTPSDNIFAEFEQMFGAAGVHPDNIKESD